MKKFVWGRVINIFEYDFYGLVCEIIKYHPHKRNDHTITKEIDESIIMYNCDEIRQSEDNIYALLISWIAEKKLGLNQHALVAGICRALKVI